MRLQILKFISHLKCLQSHQNKQNTECQKNFHKLNMFSSMAPISHIEIRMRVNEIENQPFFFQVNQRLFLLSLSSYLSLAVIVKTVHFHILQIHMLQIAKIATFTCILKKFYLNRLLYLLNFGNNNISYVNDQFQVL